MLKNTAISFFGFALVSMQLGCMGYRLGSSLQPGIDVVHVPVFVNETDEPLLEVLATQATIAEFQRDGTLSVGDADRSDVVLQARLTGFALDPLRFDRDGATSAQEYRMTIRADIRLIEQRSGNVLVNSRVNGERDFVLVGDLSSAKRTHLPSAAEDLAARIVRASIEFW